MTLIGQPEVWIPTPGTPCGGKGHATWKTRDACGCYMCIEGSYTLVEEEVAEEVAADLIKHEATLAWARQCEPVFGDAAAEFQNTAEGQALAFAAMRSGRFRCELCFSDEKVIGWAVPGETPYAIAMCPKCLDKFRGPFASGKINGRVKYAEGQIGNAPDRLAAARVAQYVNAAGGRPANGWAVLGFHKGGFDVDLISSLDEVDGTMNHPFALFGVRHWEYAAFLFMKFIEWRKGTDMPLNLLIEDMGDDPFGRMEVPRAGLSQYATTTMTFGAGAGADEAYHHYSLRDTEALWEIVAQFDSVVRAGCDSAIEESQCGLLWYAPPWLDEKGNRLPEQWPEPAQQDDEAPWWAQPDDEEAAA